MAFPWSEQTRSSEVLHSVSICCLLADNEQKLIHSCREGDNNNGGDNDDDAVEAVMNNYIRRRRAIKMTAVIIQARYISVYISAENFFM